MEYTLCKRKSMKNYAKFFKLKVNENYYQLNLTEGGLDTSGGFNKFLSVARFFAPLVGLGFVIKNLVTFFMFKTVNPADISLIFSSLVLTMGTFLPHTNLGNAYNSISKKRKLKRKTKSFYENMRLLEQEKLQTRTQKAEEKSLNKQINLTKNFIKYLKKQTRKFDKLSKNYYKKLNKNGKLSSMNEFALENLEMNQEAIDKFIFHNIGLLKIFDPKEQEFLQKRFEKRYNDIVCGSAYYDEYIWSAIHNEDLVKNDCIYKTDTSNYIKHLKRILKLEDNKIKSYEYENNNLQENDKIETKINVKQEYKQNDLIYNKNLEYEK